MNTRALRGFRIAFSVLVLLLLSFIFLDIRQLLPEKYISAVVFLQFTPSAIKFIGAGVAAAIGFIIIIVLTSLTGRTYCSFLCPLGAVQDLLSRIGGIFRRRFRRFGYRKAHTILRYSILAITIMYTLILGVNLLTLLDPYSIFGRLLTYFIKPLIILLNNALSHIFGEFDIYTFVFQPFIWFPAPVYIFASLFLLLIGVMSVTRGRLFCNTVCPVGTFLGLISKVSLLGIRLEGQACRKCGRCALSCKSSCIDFINRTLDQSRCVGCFNCLAGCPEKAITYGFKMSARKSAGSAEIDREKRSFLAAVALLVLSGSSRIAVQAKKIPVPKIASTVKENRTIPVSPPGSASVANFTDRCTACTLCIAECPNNVLVPSVREYGIASIMQPRLDYHTGFCAYECIRCLEICPTGAILPLSVEAKKLTQIGKAVFIEDNCIVKTEKTACGACAESCPTKAVHMIPYEGRLVIPETTDEICIGCGHCEFACPTIPYKAIFVNGNEIHSAAKKPDNVQTEMKKPEEFPF